ncbi:hypothetical protein [Streptomyces sannanensis]|uniref:hypothetical protein n=1 Tax=Streptomyces sannanensis TaxID=285536 RepID=UPI0031E8BBA3
MSRIIHGDGETEMPVAQDMGWGGGRAGWPPGPGGWVPQPPKPGVIPLRPLNVGDILGGAFSAAGRYFKPLFGVAAIAFGSALLLTIAAVAVAYSAVEDSLGDSFRSIDHGHASSQDVIALLVAFFAVLAAFLLGVLLATALISAAVPVVVQQAVLGRPAPFGMVWRRAWSRMPTVLGVVLLTSLCALVPIGLFTGGWLGFALSRPVRDGVGALPLFALLGLLATWPLMIWLYVLFSLAPAAAVLEGQGAIGALRRSARLVRGSWWRIFGIWLLGAVIAAVMGYFIQIPFTLAGFFIGMPGLLGMGSDPGTAEILASLSIYLVLYLIGLLVAQMVSTVLPQLVSSLLYVDRRIRTERLDAALAEAAARPSR